MQQAKPTLTSGRLDDILSALSAPTTGRRPPTRERFVELAVSLLQFERPKKRPRTGLQAEEEETSQSKVEKKDEPKSAETTEGDSKNNKSEEATALAENVKSTEDGGDKMDISDTEDPTPKESLNDQEKKVETGKEQTTETEKLAEVRTDDTVEKTAMELVRERMTNLRNVYLFGLQQVSELQDLRLAPDAILPGNTVPESAYSTK